MSLFIYKVYHYATGFEAFFCKKPTKKQLKKLIEDNSLDVEDHYNDEFSVTKHKLIN